MNQILPAPVRRTLAALALLAATALPAQQATSRASLLVSPSWLAQHLKDPNLVLLHVGAAGEYGKGHIPGARSIEMRQVATMSRDSGVLSTEMLPPSQLRDSLEAFGISDNSRVVIYYGNDYVSPSTRILLTLQYAGLGAHASLLDGGMPAWTRDGHPTTTEVPPPVRGHLSPLHPQPLIATGDFVRANKDKPGFALVDARSRGFYDGVVEGGPTKRRTSGHIPGAKSVPFDTVFTDDNVLRPAADLQAIFTKAGVKPGDTVIGYCHVGQQATAMLLAAQSLGYKVLLYDGSFEDWVYHGWPVDNPRAGGR